MEKKAKSSRGNWVITLPLVGLAIAYVFLLFLPTQKATAKLRADLDVKRKFITQAGSLAAALETTNAELKKTLKYDAAWEEKSPSQDEFFNLFGRINALARESGVTTTRFDPEPAVEYNTLKKIPLVVGYNGSFTRVFSFLRTVEALAPEVWVEDLRLVKLDETGRDVECTVTLGIFTDNPDNSDQGKRSG